MAASSDARLGESLRSEPGVQIRYKYSQTFHTHYALNALNKSVKCNNGEIFSIVSMNTKIIICGIYQSINMFAFCEWLYFGTNKKYEDQRKNEGEVAFVCWTIA